MPSHSAEIVPLKRPAPDPLPVNAVEVRGLTKIYRGTAKNPAKRALDKIDLAIPRGSIFGLLGPNGAGKSTLINILAGLVIKTEGKVWIWNIDIDTAPRAARAAIGVVPQELTFDMFFTPREHLELQAGFYGVPARERRTMEILDMVGLTAQANSLTRTLSGGMRRRLMVAKAMVHAPPVLVLDEPTAGVDVELRRHLWDQVRALNHGGTTILLTTHYLEEAEALCDRIAIIDDGHVVACDTTSELVARVDDKKLTIALAEPITALPERLAAVGLELLGSGTLVLRYNPSRAAIGLVLDAIRSSGLHIRDVTSEEADLEDIFLRLTGGEPQP
ncbi:MAG TPA: ABC transporter ATP-binding protein [Stellaceae bacterium]|nr:ABC transporter ATP-binding protein [Stellaceae bacterium]